MRCVDGSDRYVVRSKRLRLLVGEGSEQVATVASEHISITATKATRVV